MATRKKTAPKARNISREPLQEHVRASRGAGRKPVASIMVPVEIKEQFDCFKAVYAVREGVLFTMLAIEEFKEIL